MTTPINQDAHNFLQGLSDFWTRFYADAPELEAMLEGAAISIGQVYQDMMTSFLALSIRGAPLFNKELFQLIEWQEDQLTLDWALNSADDRHVAPMPGTLVEGRVLQNKVYHPTGVLDLHTDFDLDKVNYTFRFREDITGVAGRTLGSTTAGLVAAQGTLTKLYVVNTDTPFTNAKEGDWVKVYNSAAGNNKTYEISTVVDAKTVLLAPALTLAEPNSGALQCTVIDSSFMPKAGYPVRRVTVSYPSSFDDPTFRATSERSSWYADAPVGLAVRKGDVLWIKATNVSAEQELPIKLVRHDRLYFDRSIAAATGLTYTVLREPADTDVTEEAFQFSETNLTTLKIGSAGSLLASDIYDATWDVALDGADAQRYVTLAGCGAITWQASLASDGTLTRIGGATNPLARTANSACRLTLSGSSSADGTYAAAVTSTTVAKLSGVFEAEATVNITLLGVTNNGTYRIKSVSGTQVTLDQTIVLPEVNDGSVTARLHDGFRVTLDHKWIAKDSFTIYEGVGDAEHGGRRAANTTDYVLYRETGELLQTGRFAGLWGLDTAPTSVHADYSWRYALFATTTTGVLSATAVEETINRVAFWAPDALVDKYHLYNNFGYLINRFQPSSESYRQFLQGVFQLYIMGPALGRIEAALNVIAGFSVIRDDGEILVSVDTSDSDVNVVKTLRLVGEYATYSYPKAVPLRTDITAYVDGDPLIAFEAFDTLTTLFKVTDAIEDPTWWESIVIPSTLLPQETVARRTTLPILYEHVIGSIDEPILGDIGLFVGADDEGVIPAYGTAAAPKRRKLANTLMRLFLQHHMFYVRFDNAVTALLLPSFVTDLRELVLIAKPSHKYVYIEPLSAFVDVMKLKEVFAVNLNASFIDSMVLGVAGLTVQSSSWNIGDVWRKNAAVAATTFATSDGDNVPPTGTPISLGDDNIIAARIGVADSSAPILEGVHYTFDRKAGEITPLASPDNTPPATKSLWPSGDYTVEYSHLEISAQASRDVSLGDTDYAIGGLDPSQSYTNQMYSRTGVVATVGADKVFSDASVTFVAGLHDDGDHYVRITSGASEGLRRIRSVKDANSVYLEDPTVPDGTGLVWAFPSDEPRDGIIYTSGGDWFLKSKSANFTPNLKGYWIDVKESPAASSNEKLWRISAIINTYTVQLAGTPTADATGVHWKLTGTPETFDIVERPLQLTQVPV